MKIKRKIIILEKNCNNNITVLKLSDEISVRLSKTNISLWEFISLQDLIACCKSLQRLSLFPECTVYSYLKAYRLKIISDNKKVFPILSEYADRILPTKYQAELTEEYWKKIIEKQAIKTLAELSV